MLGLGDYGAESTKYGESQLRQEFDNQTQTSLISQEIEQKFRKKKFAQMNRIKTKLFKDDDQFESKYLKDQYFGVNNIPLKTKKEDIRQLEEFVSTKRPDNPFEKGKIDDRYQKVDIQKDYKYQGTSQNDVLQLRLAQKEKLQPLEENNFLQLPLEMQKEKDPEFIEKGFIRTEWLPY